MQRFEITPEDTKLLKRIIPFVCLAIPWEVYFYSGYSSGWGIKFSLFYANFDIYYGTLLVGLLEQMGLLSNGGLLPSIRTLAWIIASVICMALALYEITKENTGFEMGGGAQASIIISCGMLTLVSSFAVWNDQFRTIPIAPFFFIAFGCLLLRTERMDTKE